MTEGTCGKVRPRPEILRRPGGREPDCGCSRVVNLARPSAHGGRASQVREDGGCSTAWASPVCPSRGGAVPRSSAPPSRRAVIGSWEQGQLEDLTTDPEAGPGPTATDLLGNLILISEPPASLRGRGVRPPAPTRPAGLARDPLPDRQPVGSRPSQVVVKLAKALGVPVTELLG